MSGIRSRNTKPERLVRSALHRLGFRFRLNVQSLPGKPDIVLPRYQAALFVHGCFWHGHDCRLFKLPGTRTDFWQRKFESNRANDLKARDALIAVGWRVATVWECAIRGAGCDLEAVAQLLAHWLRSEEKLIEVRE